MSALMSADAEGIAVLLGTKVQKQQDRYNQLVTRVDNEQANRLCCSEILGIRHMKNL